MDYLQNLSNNVKYNSIHVFIYCDIDDILFGTVLTAAGGHFLKLVFIIYGSVFCIPSFWNSTSVKSSEINSNVKS